MERFSLYFSWTDNSRVSRVLATAPPRDRTTRPLALSAFRSLRMVTDDTPNCFANASTSTLSLDLVCRTISWRRSIRLSISLSHGADTEFRNRIFFR